MRLEIHKSKPHCLFFLAFIILSLTVYLGCTFLNITMGKLEFSWIPVCLLSAAFLVLVLDYLDNSPLYVCTEEGLQAKAKKTIKWSEIHDYKIGFINHRYACLKVLHLMGSNQKILQTLVLTGTDCCDEDLKQFLGGRIQKTI
ncbi:MAG: hypothetical protein M3142_15210 [Bacteroidota bacterium]|nr:hypothetical protein [Bacteroidota bacterium]